MESLNRYEELLVEALEIMDFDIIHGEKDGEYAVLDMQGAYLGDIGEFRFSSAGQLIERLTVYWDDYFISELSDEFSDAGYEGEEPYSFAEWIEFGKAHPEFADKFRWTFEVFDMVCDHSDEIDLSKCCCD